MLEGLITKWFELGTIKMDSSIYSHALHRLVIQITCPSIILLVVFRRYASDSYVLFSNEFKIIIFDQFDIG